MPEHPDNPLDDSRFPRSSGHDWQWLVEGSFGANPLWLAEWLCRDVALEPGMRVLDLGCGRAKSSIFLAREFGVRVWAADLWIDPADNLRSIEEAGLVDAITPLHADARELPFADGYFDAVLAFDSYQYYGTDTMFLNTILRVLRPGGTIAFASAGLMREFEHGVPEHLRRFWTPDCACIRTLEFWRSLWERSGLVDVDTADAMPDGIDLWRTWARACDCSDWYLEALDQDAGEYLGYLRVIAERRPDAVLWQPPA